MRMKNNIYSYINYMSEAFNDEEYQKALKFYKFLVQLTQCSNGFLNIDRESFLKLAMVIMNYETPYEAYEVIRKMLEHGLLKDLKKDYVIVNLKTKTD